jgi:uncharacterized protein YodC (DUF2158 family)
LTLEKKPPKSMAQSEIKKGDTVMLKSGGPVMTVQWIDEYGGAMCSWFDGNTPHHGKYSSDSLKVVNPEDYE